MSVRNDYPVWTMRSSTVVTRSPSRRKRRRGAPPQTRGGAVDARVSLRDRSHPLLRWSSRRPRLARRGVYRPTHVRRRHRLFRRVSGHSGGAVGGQTAVIGILCAFVDGCANRGLHRCRCPIISVATERRWPGWAPNPRSPHVPGPRLGGATGRTRTLPRRHRTESPNPMSAALCPAKPPGLTLPYRDETL